MSKNHHSGRYAWLALWANIFSIRYPKSYLAFSLALMLLGYMFLLLFPFLVFESSTVLIKEISHARTTEHWIVVEILSVILLLCLFLSRQIFRLHFPRVSGLELSKELAPDLYALIGKLRKFTSQPSIRNIMLTDQYELRIEETPRLGYPFGTSNTLVIGMPMLQTLSEAQFRGELLRKMSQYSSGRFRLAHWLFRARLLWQRYSDALDRRNRLSEMPMRLFFSLYTPLFSALTLPAARMDELAGDSAVLEWMNDRDYFETIKSSTIAEIFLKAHYWRKVHKLSLKNPNVKINPFAELEHISGHLQSTEFRRRWLQGAFSVESNIYKAMPVLRQRMENIGQSTLREVPIVEKTAAEILLGESRINYISIIDKLWYSTTFLKWKKDYEQRRDDIVKVKKLSKRSQQEMLSLRDTLLYARLAKQLRGDSRCRSILKLVKRNVGRLLPANFNWNFVHRKIKHAQGGDDILS